MLEFAGLLARHAGAGWGESVNRALTRSAAVPGKLGANGEKGEA